MARGRRGSFAFVTGVSHRPWVQGRGVAVGLTAAVGAAVAVGVGVAAGPVGLLLPPPQAIAAMAPRVMKASLRWLLFIRLPPSYG